VAPTVAALLGIPFDAPDGIVFRGMLSDPPCSPDELAPIERAR